MAAALAVITVDCRDGCKTGRMAQSGRVHRHVQAAVVREGRICAAAFSRHVLRQGPQGVLRGRRRRNAAQQRAVGRCARDGGTVIPLVGTTLKIATEADKLMDKLMGIMNL